MSELDVVLSKINIIKNCLMAIEKARTAKIDPDFLMPIYEVNLQRAVQACVDLANVTIAKEGLGLPATYAQSFAILEKHGAVDATVAKVMKSMVGFRNISVHEYSAVKPEIVQAIVTKHLLDFETFYTLMLARAKIGRLKNSVPPPKRSAQLNSGGPL